MNCLYTIGHSQHSLEKFLNMLKTYDINYVLDIRSIPFSRYAPQFNRDQLKNFLQGYSINYANMAIAFGARQNNKNLYTIENYLDFEKVRNTAQFKQAFDNVLKGLNEGNKIAFMCTEKNPSECHRSIMVTKAFSDANIPIKHILEDFSYILQDDINDQLLNMYFPDRDQYNIFDYIVCERNDEDLIAKAYRMRNKEIGYQMKMEDIQCSRG